MSERRKVIFVTDGDEHAQRAVSHVANEIGGRCISRSSGNPTTLSGEEIVSLILETPHDPVLIMFDDCGIREEGAGEQAMRYVAMHPKIEVIGAVAVASATHSCEWAHVDVSIDRYGHLTEFGVDKEGIQDIEIGRINGDTVYVLDELDLPVVVGIGDIGKMAGGDTVKKGSPITKKAVEIILERSGYHDSQSQENPGLT